MTKSCRNNGREGRGGRLLFFIFSGGTSAVKAPRPNARFLLRTLVARASPIWGQSGVDAKLQLS
eukprot:3338691-Pleurochrysis_carterae.AAC.1